MKIKKAFILFGFMLGFLLDPQSIIRQNSDLRSAVSPNPWETSSDKSVVQSKAPDIKAQSVLSITLSFVGEYTTTLPVSTLDVEDNIAYITVGEGDLQMVDVSDPSNPVQIGEYNTPGILWDFDIVSQFAYLADGNSFIILDISNPINPTLIATYGQSQYNNVYQHIAIANQIVFLAVAGFEPYTGVFEVSDPKHPVLIREYIPYFYSLRSQGNLAYLTYFGDISGGLWVWDISNPSQLETISYYKFFLAGGENLEISGNLVGFYLNAIPQAAVPSGLIFLDVSNSSQPEFIYRYERKVTAIDAIGRIFVIGVQDETTVTGRLQLLEVIRQDHVRLLDSVDIPWRINRIKVKGDFVYVTAGDGGLLIYRINFPYKFYFPFSRR